MKTLFLSALVLGATIGTSLSAKADQDRRDHGWNDGYWHDHHEGYWHGHRGHWGYQRHRHRFIEVGPVTIERH
jgi:hypothetical protein